MDKATFEKEVSIIRDLSREYGAKNVILFGSCVKEFKTANDIDVGVSGVMPEKFYILYGKILGKVYSDVDLVDLDKVDKYFSKRVMETGVVLL